MFGNVGKKQKFCSISEILTYPTFEITHIYCIYILNKFNSLIIFIDRTGPLNSVEAFELNTQSWQECSLLTTARKHPAVAILGGMIYCVGGIDNSGRDLMCVEKYDPSLNQWTFAASLKTCKGNFIINICLLHGLLN